MKRIRLADIPDIPAIIEIGYELLENSVYNGIKADEQRFKFTLASMMGSKNGIVLVIVDDDNKPQGFFVGMVEELFFSSQQYATDLVVYVRKKYRRYAPAMIKKFIAWAKNKPKVVDITFGISSGLGNIDRTGKMYEQLGFEFVGGNYMKQVSYVKSR